MGEVFPVWPLKSPSVPEGLGLQGLVSSLLAPLGAASGRSTLGWGAGQRGVPMPVQHPSIPPVPLAGGLRGAWA